jgi:hypothetical protein
MKTIKRSELNGVTGWLSKDGTLRICSMGTRWYRDGYRLETCHTDDECKRCHDIPLTGDSLIAALRERGVEVIDDVACETCNDRGKVPSGVYEMPAEPCPTCKATQPALGGPDDEYARKWADENGYEVVGYRLPKKGEKYWDYRVNRLDSAHTDYQHEKAYILTPKAKPVETKPDKWAHLPEGGEWAKTERCVFHRLNGVMTRYQLNGQLDEGGKCTTNYFFDSDIPISRAEAIAIFEANAKPEVNEWGTFGLGGAIYHWIGDDVDVYAVAGGFMYRNPWSCYANAASEWRPLTPAEVEAFKAKIAAYAKPEAKPTETPAFKVGDRVEVVGPFDENWNLYVESLQRCIGKVGTVRRIDSDGVIYTDIALGSHGGFMFHPANLRPAPVDTKAKEPAGDEVAKLRKELDEAKATIKNYQAELAHWSKAATDKRQPPMSDERFRQEAMLRIMQGLVAATIENTEAHHELAKSAAKMKKQPKGLLVENATAIADALLAAMKGGAA